jgi:hypothetical protein
MIIINGTTISEIKKLNTERLLPLATPFINFLISILIAPSNKINIKAKVVNKGAAVEKTVS